MHRNLIAAALAAAVLPLASFGAAAAPGAATTYGKTYDLPCRFYKPNQIVVRNTTGQVIEPGTRMHMTLRYTQTRSGTFASHSASYKSAVGIGINQTQTNSLSLFGEQRRFHSCNVQVTFIAPVKPMGPAGKAG